MKQRGIFVLSLLLFACSSGVRGEYMNDDGTVIYKFESGGRLHRYEAGNATELKYEINDRKIRVAAPEGDQILVVMDDGSLRGTRGIKLIKKR